MCSRCSIFGFFSSKRISIDDCSDLHNFILYKNICNPFWFRNHWPTSPFKCLHWTLNSTLALAFSLVLFDSATTAKMLFQRSWTCNLINNALFVASIALLFFLLLPPYVWSVYKYFQFEINSASQETTIKPRQKYQSST